MVTYRADKLTNSKWVNFDFEVEVDPEGQGQSPPQNNRDINYKVFYTHGPNLVILAWTGDELSRGQTWWRADRRTEPFIELLGRS